MNRISKCLLFGTSLLLSMLVVAHAGTATNVTGLYFTGTNNITGTSLASNGSVDSHWTITYATTNGGVSADSNYMNAAYVLSNGKNFSAWKDATNAQWIVPPQAISVDTWVTGSKASTGNDAVPGNGTTGTNAASYVYTLTFNIAGDNAGSIVTNRTSITLTLAADDQASVYVNPTLIGGAIDTANSRLGGTITNAWTNTKTITLQNYDDGTNGDNAVFKIGTNTLVIQVDNTNSITGSSTTTSSNPSGLLVYQTGSAILIDPRPVPEVGVWLPIIGALGLFFWQRHRPLTMKVCAVAAH